MAFVKKSMTGMKDILPKEMELREYLLGIIQSSYKSYGFNRIETPALEDISNLTGGQGGDNEKLIFKILKRGEKLNLETAQKENDLVDAGLRYDLTVPLARYYANNSDKLISPFKSLQIGSVWRAERPQKGRFRQFTQCDIDILGDATNAAEIELILATTTGTSSSNRVEAMVKNAVAGIITAKSLGVENPSLGILNLDGARTAEKILKEIAALGYNINFSESKRADGGVVMRGNDLLLGTPDVMVTDSLTGNVLMKMFSSFTSGGEYEVSGYGYGPGVGEGFKRNILIISRASGAPVIANALKYAFDISNGDIEKYAETEYQSLAKLNWQSVIDKYTAKKETKTAEAKVEAPSKEAVTEQISGVDVMDIDDAVQMLWKAGIYAEGGMGCTGPVVLVNAAKFDKALELIKKEGFASVQ